MLSVPSSRFARSRHVVALAVSLWLISPAATVARQSDTSTAAAMYERAQGKEQVARGLPPPALKELRIAAAAYERLFRGYPASGYSDNALWQAAGLLSLAFERGGEATDRHDAQRWLQWLRKEYPTSPLARKVQAALQALEPRPAVAARSTPPAAPAATDAPVSSPAAPGAPASIRSVTATPLPQGQRISIEFTQEVRYTGDRVESPDRVFFDFSNATISDAVAARAQAIGGTFVKDVRVGHPAAGVTRFVLDLAGRPRYSAYTFYDPFRLVIDVVDAQAPASTATAAAAKPSGPAPRASTPSWPAAASTTRSGDYTLGRQLGLGVSRIVIDAGHGGHDPGATAHGVSEAEIVLDVALRLEKLLKDAGGFQVVLTRNSDEFIALEERTAIVKREDADLFLSIHVNASPDASTRGVETYFLNFASTQAEASVAARENATSARTMSAVPEFVKAITLNNKAKESREFATFVQTAMVRKMSVQNRALKDLGVKQAPFRVLIGADMPSVLAEVSFLTNKNEASLLKQPTFRQRIAASLCDAILSYQSSLKRVTTVASRDGGR